VRADAPPTIPKLDPDKLAERVGEILQESWKTNNVSPAAPADDAEFLRRVYLHLAGRIPSVNEARNFLEDKRADKRERLVNQLLESARYVTHFTNVWRALLLPEARANIQVNFGVGGLDAWLRRHLTDNTPMDKIVRELLTAQIADGGRGGFVPFGGNG